MFRYSCDDVLANDWEAKECEHAPVVGKMSLANTYAISKCFSCGEPIIGDLSITNWRTRPEPAHSLPDVLPKPLGYKT